MCIRDRRQSDVVAAEAEAVVQGDDVPSGELAPLSGHDVQVDLGVLLLEVDLRGGDAVAQRQHGEDCLLYTSRCV